MATTTPSDLAAGYFAAWSDNDTAALRALISDDVTFEGPLASVAGGDAYAESIKGLFGATTGLTVEKRWVDGADVLTWFLLAVGDAEPTPVASWIHTDGGRIARVRVTFDPRGML